MKALMRWLGLRLWEGGLVGVGHWFECVRKSGFGGRGCGDSCGGIVILLWVAQNYLLRVWYYGTVDQARRICELAGDFVGA